MQRCKRRDAIGRRRHRDGVTRKGREPRGKQGGLGARGTFHGLWGCGTRRLGNVYPVQRGCCGEAEAYSV